MSTNKDLRTACPASSSSCITSPLEFIRIAEETRVIIDIGDWVFGEAADQSARWRAQYDSSFQIAVNTSLVQFHSEVFDIGGWLDYLRELGPPGNAVGVEITEGILMEAVTVTTKKLPAFRDAGVQVSLDDFGTGYSSLSCLKKFDVNYLKIDRSFLQNLEPGNDEMALCEANIVMAHKLGLKVVAEGIEVAHQRDLLRDAGCDYAQGIFFRTGTGRRIRASDLRNGHRRNQRCKRMTFRRSMNSSSAQSDYIMKTPLPVVCVSNSL